MDLRNLGHDKGICPECLAGLSEYPFEDNRRAPCWEATLQIENPWIEGKESPLLQIPSRRFSPQLFFRRDPFHTWKQSLGGHWVASSIVLLMDFGYFGDGGVEECFWVAYRDFDWFMKKEWHGKHVAHMKHFTRQLLHWPRADSFPHCRPKGSDVMLITRWLKRLLECGVYDAARAGRTGVSITLHPLQAWHAPFFRAMAAGSGAALSFFRVMHTSGIWLSRDLARQMSDNAYTFVEAYSALANLSFQAKLARFHMEPSYHFFHHYGVEYRLRIEAGEECILSCSVDGCEADEDFVGKISLLSRKVHAATVSLRVLQRYMLTCRAIFSNDEILTL